jgi:hypothetical protein
MPAPSPYQYSKGWGVCGSSGVAAPQSGPNTVRRLVVTAAAEVGSTNFEMLSRQDVAVCQRPSGGKRRRGTFGMVDPTMRQTSMPASYATSHLVLLWLTPLG